jgi:N-acetylglucosamine malate deacetylase 1
MVLSPHPDDDVLGCGGTLCRYYNKGSHIKTIILTDGSMGMGTADECDLVSIRKNEAIAGASCVGCNDLIFLYNIDTKLRANRKNKDAILEQLRNFNPEIIFVPSIFENHPDHIESTIILAYALREYEGHPLCYCYEIWGPLFPNILIDITNQIENKKKAINVHWSQITHQNMKDSILGLNSYRAFGLGKDIKSCEAFYKCSKEEFIKMVLQHY